jgi:hypothetical protein
MGNSNPLLIQFITERNTRPITNRIIFTGREPTFLLAASKDNAVIDQKKATSKAANSP